MQESDTVTRTNEEARAVIRTISTKATICNFCVKQQGLEDQLLGTVVRKERPELEAQKNDLVVALLKL